MPPLLPLGNMTAFQHLPCTSLLTVASAEQKVYLVGIRPLSWHVCNASSGICLSCWFIRGSVPSKHGQNLKKKRTSYHNLIRCYSPLSTSQITKDTNSHPTIFCVHFIWKSWHDLKSHIKKPLSVVRWQEILTDTLLLCQEILLSQVSGVANFMGACQGSLSLVVALFGATKSCRGEEGMKLRSSFDKPEKRRQRICQKLEIALKEQLVGNLANSQLCETFKS